MVVVAIISVLIAGVFSVMDPGQDAWWVVGAEIRVREQLRAAQARITREFRETGSDKDGNPEMFITAGGGPDGTDMVKFAVPVWCDDTMNLIDSEGDVAQWGATLTWGCRDLACMDQDGSCAVKEYRYIEYRLSEDGRLERRVLGPDDAVVSSQVFADRITDFRAASQGGCVVAFALTGAVNTARNRTVGRTVNWEVQMRNRRCSL
jgi:hypothetical protein